MGIVVLVDGKSDLAKLRETRSASRCVPDLLNTRKQKAQ
jgi:hypothetical protein